MRQYNEENQLEKVICNQCKKELILENGILKEGHFEGKQTFGYFSDKDEMPVEEIEEKEIF